MKTSSFTETTWSSFVARKFTYYACEMTSNGSVVTHDAALHGLAAQGRMVREAATALGQASDDQRRAVLLHVADRLEERLRSNDAPARVQDEADDEDEETAS